MPWPRDGAGGRAAWEPVVSQQCGRAATPYVSRVEAAFKRPLWSQARWITVIGPLREQPHLMSFGVGDVPGGPRRVDVLQLRRRRPGRPASFGGGCVESPPGEASAQEPPLGGARTHHTSHWETVHWPPLGGLSSRRVTPSDVDAGGSTFTAWLSRASAKLLWWLQKRGFRPWWSELPRL